MNLIKSLTSKLSISYSSPISSFLINTKRFESTTDNLTDKNNIYHTEPLPPLPPKPLWKGDANTRVKDYIKHLPSRFKYGY
jgi:hypothetical protein